MLSWKNPIFGGEMGAAAKGSGASRPDQKIGPLGEWVDLLGQPLTLKLVSKHFGPEPPLERKD